MITVSWLTNSTVKEFGSPTVIYTAGKEGCHLFIFIAGPYSTAAIRRPCKGTMDFCHYLPPAAGCTVKNMAGPYIFYVYIYIYTHRTLYI